VVVYISFHVYFVYLWNERSNLSFPIHRAAKLDFSPSMKWPAGVYEGVPANVRVCAEKVVERISSIQTEKAHFSDYVKATAIFIAFRIHGSPRPMAEVCKTLGGIATPQAINCHNHIVGKLYLPELSIRKPDSPPADFKKPKGTGTLVTRWCKDLGVFDIRVQQRCEEVSRLLASKNREAKPRLVAAAGVYLVTQNEGVNLRDLAELASVPAHAILSILPSAVEKKKSKKFSQKTQQGNKKFRLSRVE